VPDTPLGRARRARRRYTPERWRQDHAANIPVVSAPPEAFPQPVGPVALPDGVFGRLLALFGIGSPAAVARQARGADLVAARHARLPVLAARLEAVLAELDAIEAWREAAELCAIIEQWRGRMADSPPTPAAEATGDGLGLSIKQ
jgi:hypothetical protein